jgi:hypothetical protein
LNLTSRILHGAARCSCSERLMGKLVYRIIGAERCIAASKAAENKEDY